MEMEKQHPMMRGLWLAAAVVLPMLFVGHADVLPAYGQAARLAGQTVPSDRFVIAMAVMIIPGAFLAALPFRMKKEEKRGETTGRSLLMAFLGGILLVLGFGVAGGGMAAGLLFSGVDAGIFLLAACVTGFLLIRMGGGEKA